MGGIERKSKLFQMTTMEEREGKNVLRNLWNRWGRKPL